MTKLFATLALLIATSAFAEPTLKDNMKALNAQYKQVKATMADRGQNTANADRADKMAALFVAVRTQFPDTVTSLPEPQRQAAIADFQRLMDAEKQFCADLKAAFAAGDNNAAAGIVSKMDLDKKEGHDKYNRD